MNYKNFLKSAKEFRDDTREWDKIDQYQFYCTKQPYGWYESTDGANGGLDVSWAFQLTNNDIEKTAPAEFLNQLQANLENLLEDDAFSKDEIIEYMRENFFEI